MYKHSHKSIRISSVFHAFTATFPTESDHQWKATMYMLHKEYLWQVMIML